MNSSYDRWLTTPPDDNEPEIPICESCGHEKEILDNFGGQRYTKCVNPYCPDKHEGIAKEMAETIVELVDTIDCLRAKIKALGGKA